ncbi:uncharacterized protein LOC110842057 [Folsomia candida]|uniref:uncharacterized protein LOC110842057 n=1 Tax=Folsomia candida TaxID=158441 RepID=UPI000B8FB038|nr:uncharacterized protein LOC110842057 [Folsomia candida]XP_021943462.1 uncharacterized protein LOC110842057 [Folsomia candida]
MSDTNMALSSLHEMIRNLSTYIKSLEVLCESGVTLAKNFERLLSPGPGALGACTSSGTTIDSDMLTQSVSTWELAHKVATADSNGLISELLPLLQETVQSVMHDPASFNSANTYEVFRSCFSAFFQIQWRFCQLYISCASSAHGSFLRSPDTHMARSPTMASFSSSSDRRESTESCMSGFSLPRSSFSGVSSFSSRSSSPGPGGLHLHPFGGRSRTSSLFESSPSVKFTPSQPPSPLMPYGGDSYQPYLFRRWSAHTHTFANPTIGSGSGHNSGSNSGSSGGNYSSIGGYGSGSSYGGGSSSGGGGGVGAGFALSSAFPFSRRWSVPANQPPGSTTDSGRRTEPSDIDYGLMDAINLLSTKPPTPSNHTLRDIPLEESRGEYGDDAGDEDEPQTTSLWPPSETMPGVVLTTCGSDPEVTTSALDTLQQQTAAAAAAAGTPSSLLNIPYGVPSPPSGLQSPDPTNQPRLGPVGSGIQTSSSMIHGQSGSGEYTLFGNSANPTRN